MPEIPNITNASMCNAISSEVCLYHVMYASRIGAGTNNRAGKLLVTFWQVKVHTRREPVWAVKFVIYRHGVAYVKSVDHYH